MEMFNLLNLFNLLKQSCKVERGCKKGCWEF